MYRQQFDALDKNKMDSTLSVSDFSADDRPRTLLYGYTADKHTFHVYLKENGVIARVIYSYNGEILDYVEGAVLPSADLNPNKRIYPERTDAEFAQALINREDYVSFANWSDETVERINWDVPFYGGIVVDGELVKF